MPAKSKAQLRAMYAAAEGRGILGIPPSVAREFVHATTKRRAKRLPERKKRRTS